MNQIFVFLHRYAQILSVEWRQTIDKHIGHMVHVIVENEININGKGVFYLSGKQWSRLRQL